jgi:hypothetical protein
VEYSDGSLELLYRPLNSAGDTLETDAADSAEIPDDRRERFRHHPVFNAAGAFVDAPNAG